MADNEKARDLLKKHEFLVMIDNKPFGFSKISNVILSLEHETIQEGGVNDRVYMAPKPQAAPQKLTLEKGISLKGALEQVFIPGKVLQSGITIAAMKKGCDPKYLLCSDSCVVAKWEFDGFDAMGSGLLLRKVEILHNGFYEKLAK